MILVDRADGARLRELFLALLPDHPDLELYTDPRSLLDLPDGTTLVLAPSAEHADWLNISRPLFAERSLRVILWCDAETSKALARRATDFFDWISHRVECPPGVPAFAVEGLRCALLARAPGVIWRGEHLARVFQLAFPGRRIRWLSPKASLGGLKLSTMDRGSDWIGFIDLDGEARLRLIALSLTSLRCRGRVILDHPNGRLPGWHLVHDQIASTKEARQRLERLGAMRPGRLAALAGLEPEALTLAEVLLDSGIMEQTIEESSIACGDPGAALCRLAADRHLVDVQDPVAIDSNPPWLRAFARNSEIKQRRRAALAALAPELMTPPEMAAALYGELQREQSILALMSPILSSNLALASNETKLREALTLLEQGMPQKDDLYAQGLGALARILAKQARYEEAESLFRQGLAILELLRPAEKKGHWHFLLGISEVLLAQGRRAEAELFAARAMQVLAEVVPARWVVEALCRLAVVQSALRTESALATASRALDMLPRVFPPDDPACGEAAARIDEILAGIRNPD